ncbi:MAG: hypothetical protein JW966_01785 [Anaerolineae bacterium]|nr:hypothetical protein [Anaerolineae bacterium]
MHVVNRFGRTPPILAVLLPVLVALALLLSACETLNGGADIDDLETRNAQLQATIDVLGTPGATVTALQMTAERGMVLQAEMNNIQGTALALQSTLAAFQLGGAQPAAATSQPAPDVATGAAPPAAVTPPPADSETLVYEMTTSTGRDSNDCANGVTAIFDTTEDVIYAVARISNLKTGSTISARWLANGSLFEDSVCWTPTQDWADVCAYCEITPTDGTFTAGSWTVEMLLDSQLQDQVQFQVIDSSQNQPEAQVTTDAAGQTGDDMGTEQ